MNDPAVIGIYRNGLCPPPPQTGTVPSDSTYPLSASTGTSYEAAPLSSLLSLASDSNGGSGNNSANGAMFPIGSLQEQQQSQIPVHSLLGMNFNPNAPLPASEDMIDRAASAPLVNKFIFII